MIPATCTTLEPRTLAEIRSANPGLFYPGEWFIGQAFMDIEPDTTVTRPPAIVRGIQPDMLKNSFAGDILKHAATLARLYVQEPGDKLWESFLWTKDFDEFGQRVYVGGVSQGTPKGFQIHRHLNITNLWGVPSWG